MPHSIRETARAIIVQDDRLLLIRRSRQNSEGSIDNWLSIPGGGLDPGETPHHAVVREMQEELGIMVDVSSLLAIQDVPSDESRHYYFACTIREGVPMLQEASEEYERMQAEVPNTYAIEWTRVDSPKLPGELFWSYAEAYVQFEPFIRTGRSNPLLLTTTGNASASNTVVGYESS